MCDLLFVAVEHERRLLAGKEPGANNSLAFLAPARMIDIRVHVGVKAVFVRCELIPKRFWLLSHKLYFRQRLRAFESVLPRNNEAERCTVLVTERLAVKTDCDKRQPVHRLWQSEAFGVWPRKIVTALSRTIRGIEERGKFHILRFQFWLRKIHEFRQRKTFPRNHHRPSFDATMPIVAALDGPKKPNQFVNIQDMRVATQSADLDGPRPSFPA